jgi:hypothetical protein
MNHVYYPCQVYHSNTGEKFIFPGKKQVQSLQTVFPWDHHSPKVVSILKHLRFEITPATELQLEAYGRSNVVHIIHLRNEEDAIQWWAKQNKMSCQEFRNALQKKYESCIQMHIEKLDEPIIVITSKVDDNPVLAFMNEKGYWVVQCKKHNKGRELNAIEDLLFAEKYARGGCFIGCAGGSTFSSCLLSRRIKYSKSVQINLDNLLDEPTIKN